MRSKIISVFVIAAILAGSYIWYVQEFTPCRSPITYSIGVVDERFAIGEDELRSAVKYAEQMWEDASGTDLFVLDDTSDFTINFIYDERQATADHEQYLGEVLQERKELSDDVRGEYESVLIEYESMKVAYETAVTLYETRVSAYEEEVAEWNSQGGAPPEVFAELGEQQRALTKEQKGLSQKASDLNRLVKKLNSLGEEGNGLVNTYNDAAEAYNNRFGSGYDEEFTQGDYQGDAINIYEYRNKEDLRLVLAHELGHAAGLGHVGNEESIMYYLMDSQSTETGVTIEDLAELQRVCDASPISGLFR